MSELNCAGRKHRVEQEPSYVSLFMGDSEFIFPANEFKVFVAWLSAENKLNIKSGKEIYQEISERHNASRL